MGISAHEHCGGTEHEKETKKHVFTRGEPSFKQQKWEENSKGSKKWILKNYLDTSLELELDISWDNSCIVLISKHSYGICRSVGSVYELEKKKFALHEDMGIKIFYKHVWNWASKRDEKAQVRRRRPKIQMTKVNEEIQSYFQEMSHYMGSWTFHSPNKHKTLKNII